MTAPKTITLSTTSRELIQTVYDQNGFTFSVSADCEFAVSDSPNADEIISLSFSTNYSFKNPETFYIRGQIGDVVSICPFDAISSKGGGGGGTGLATEATLANVETNTNNLDAPISGLALETGGNLDTISSDTTNIDTKFGEVQATPTENTLLGRLKDIVEAIISDILPPTASHKSPADFQATFTSTTTITLSGHTPFTDSSQIAYIKYVPLLGANSGILVNGQNGVTMTISGDVITVDGAGTPFLAGDKYEVGINYQKKAYNQNHDGNKTLEQAYAPRFSSSELGLTNTAVSSTVTRTYGPLINIEAMAEVGLSITKTAHATGNLLIRPLYKTEEGGVDYSLTDIGTPVLGISPILEKIFSLDTSAQTRHISIPSGAKYVRMSYKLDTGATGSTTIDTIITKSPRG